MEMLNALAGFFQSGGPFMVPIGLVLLIGVAIALERFLFLSRVLGAIRREKKLLIPLLAAGKLTEVRAKVKLLPGALGNLYRCAFERMETGRRRQDLEYALEEGLLETLPAVEKRTPYLATFANIATLLGLLGTIIGLIAAFTAVAGADPAEKATLLSQSISIAMNTTAFGLMVAIPLLLVHAYLQGKTREIVEHLDVAMVKFLNCIERQGAVAPTVSKAA